MKVHLDLARIVNAPHLLTNFEIQKYYQNEHNLNGIYSKNNLPKTKDEASVINLDENESIETHWIALHVNNNDITYFRVENIPKKKRKLIGNKNIIKNIYSKCRNEQKTI